MAEFQKAEIECYLKSTLGSSVHILALKILGESSEEEIKSYGYGKPLLLDYELDGTSKTPVLHTVKPGPFGHEHMADRAQGLLWDHASFNLLPKHIRSIDVAAMRRNGSAVSLGDAEEFFILTDYAEGHCHAEEFFRMRDDARLRTAMKRTDVNMKRMDSPFSFVQEKGRKVG